MSYLGHNDFGHCKNCGTRILLLPHHCNVIEEYDSAADWLARRGFKGEYGEPLPENISMECVAMIEDDLDAFKTRIAERGYASAETAGTGDKL